MVGAGAGGGGGVAVAAGRPAFAALGPRYPNLVGKTVPWNQNAMLANGFLSIAMSLDVLGEEPDTVAKYDAIVAPSRHTVSFPIDRDFDKSYPGLSGGPPLIPAGNAVGQPALSVPNGFGLKGLPTGLQFTGRAWSEARLVRLAAAYQQATDWHKRRPPALK